MESSGTIEKIAPALVAAQADIGPLVPTETVSFGDAKGGRTYQYIDLASLREIVRPVLHKHGLGLVQTFGQANGDAVVVHTTLLHSSGEWLRTSLTMPYGRGSGPQAVGSAITYARRYSVCAMLGLAADRDDDGKAAQDATQGHARGQGPTQTAPTTQKTTQAPQTQQAQQQADAPSRETIRIVSVAVAKTGQGAKGPWTKWSVVDEQGRSIATFSKAAADTAKAICNAGQLALIETESTQYGLNLRTITVAPEQAPAAKPPAEMPTPILGPLAVRVLSIEEKTEHHDDGPCPVWVLVTPQGRFGTYTQEHADTTTKAKAEDCMVSLYYQETKKGNRIISVEQVGF